MHGWGMTARLSLLGARHTLKKLLHWEGRESKVNELILPHFAVHSYSWRWAALEMPAWFGATKFLHLPMGQT